MTSDINEYPTNNLEPKLTRLLALIHRYNDAEQQSEDLERERIALEKEKTLERYKLTIKKGNELSNEQERLERLLKECHKQYVYETTDLGNGKVHISIIDPDAPPMK